MLHGLGYVRGLHRIELHRLALIDRAEAAVACTSVAAEHKCGRFIGPALEDVRTFRFLANRVEVKTLDEIQNGILIRRIAQLDLQPVRLLEAFAVLAVNEFLDQDLLFDHKRDVIKAINILSLAHVKII
jgi:hypothetical protein